MTRSKSLALISDINVVPYVDLMLVVLIVFMLAAPGDAKLEEAAARYAGEKGNLRFPLDEPIPYELIKRLTRLRARQDLAAARAKRRRD